MRRASGQISANLKCVFVFICFWGVVLTLAVQSLGSGTPGIVFEVVVWNFDGIKKFRGFGSSNTESDTMNPSK